MGTGSGMGDPGWGIGASGSGSVGGNGAGPGAGGSIGGNGSGMGVLMRRAYPPGRSWNPGEGNAL